MSNSKDFVKSFITIYRDNPALWKVRSKDYQDKDLKEIGLKLLLDKMKEVERDANKDVVNKKINNLRSSYRKEMKKVLASIKSADSVYKPKLWYYNLLSFLNEEETRYEDACVMNQSYHEEWDYSNDDQSSTKQLIIPIKESLSDNENDSNDVENYTDPICNNLIQPILPETECHMEEDPLSTTILTPQSQQVRPNKRKLSPTVSVEEDRHSLFGKNIAVVLRYVDNTQRILATKLINEVLFEAEMGTLTTDHYLTKKVTMK